jgi:hypothetical protein
MTLATIALFSVILSAASARPLPAETAARQSATQPAPASKPADASTAPSQDPAPQATTPSPATNTPPATKPSPGPKPSGQSASGHGQTTAARRPRRKKGANANCAPAPAAAAGSASSTDPPAPGATVSPAPASTPPGSAPASDSAAAGAPTNCPPSKIIVRQGGTSEPSIRLAGATRGDQADLRRHTARLLGATDENLKKIAGRQLSQDQQNMVAQIHQFTDQSKAAATAGDLERADTLALKAQLLSEELVKPQK